MAQAREIRDKLTALKTRKKLRVRWKWLLPVKCVKRKIAWRLRDPMPQKFAK